MQIPLRRFGTNGPLVSALALGSWHTWDRAVFEEAISLVREARDNGVTTFDVGVYRSKGVQSIDPYDSTTDLVFARIVQEAGLRREDYTLAVKGWIPNKPGAPTIRDHVEATLRRHGTDHAELLLLGDVMHPELGFDAYLEEVRELLAEGLVGSWGVNNWSAGELGAAHAAALDLGMAPPVGAQLKYGMFRRSIGEGPQMQALLAATGMSIQASDVFEGGLIFGNPTSRVIANDPGSVRDAILDARPRLEAVAKELGTTVARFVIATPLANPDTACVLIGTRTIEQLRDDLGAIELLDRVGADEIRRLAEPFWLDNGRVDPESSWSHVPHDVVEHYASVVR